MLRVCNDLKLQRVQDGEVALGIGYGALEAHNCFLGPCVHEWRRATSKDGWREGMTVGEASEGNPWRKRGGRGHLNMGNSKKGTVKGFWGIMEWLFISKTEHLTEKEKKKKRKGERKRERKLNLLSFAGSLLQCPQHPRLNQAKVRSQELLAAFPDGWQGSNYLNCHVLPSNVY